MYSRPNVDILFILDMFGVEPNTLIRDNERTIKKISPSTSTISDVLEGSITNKHRAVGLIIYYLQSLEKPYVFGGERFSFDIRESRTLCVDLVMKEVERGRASKEIDALWNFGHVENLTEHYKSIVKPETGNYGWRAPELICREIVGLPLHER